MEKTAAKYSFHFIVMLKMHQGFGVTVENFQEGSQKEDFSKNSPQNGKFLFKTAIFLHRTKTHMFISSCSIKIVSLRNAI